MLHRIELPVCEAQLREVLDFQEAVLRFACTSPANVNLESLRQALGAKAGIWFWEHLYYHGKYTCLHTYFKTLSDYVTQNPDAGGRIIAAFTNDREFFKHIDDANYHFQQHTALTKADVRAIKPLMVAFYERLFASSGFPVATHPQTGGDILKREDWNEAFWKKNQTLQVCPYCDGQRPGKTRLDRTQESTGEDDEGKILSDVDHFFPKDDYPFLTVHPDNLVPMCLECNERIKLTRDPIDDHTNVPLINCFHPYHRPAIEHISVGCSRTETGKLKIKLTEKDGTDSRRVKNMVAILDLEFRWAAEMENFVNRFAEVLKDDPTIENLKQLMSMWIKLNPPRLGAYGYLESQLVPYILKTPDEVNSLWQTIKRCMTVRQ